ncbi:mRNA cap guanine-N7 methyltransferase isoform X2 [Zootermopsis nevadensis]|uniref:mRNA cap guanine-N7 methyltransferase isoform X2 n=1 Tax=Zootermopsis nevadensis TaxID=136037 RepID=UPI000B8EDE01|nr:mRNA cap guanine-N7 methyltransferase isoform X2 [Zootermopsis nevadensis]
MASSVQLLHSAMNGDSVGKTGEGPNNTSVPSDLSTRARHEESQGHGSVVATHYNTLEERGLAERCKSRIFYLRNFNNWIKSMMINEYLSKSWQGKPRGAPMRVLDMCCGKGGDLLKWRRGNITHLVCADIAEVSVEQCQVRYNDLQNRSKNERGFAPVFTAEFISADCTKVRLRERYKDPSMELDLVSCQFSFHYCFESLPQAENMVRNAAECLRPGGYFIGTIPDAYEIMNRQQNTGGTFGNEIYKVEFQCDMKPPLPLFGAKYNFHLEGVVDCPEFLVHFPTLVKLAEKYGLQLIAKEHFGDYYQKVKEEGRSLLGKMQALETYPPFHEAPLLGHVPDDYEHVQQYMQKSTGHRKVGTLSKSEWEAASLYLVFAFQKDKTWRRAEERSECGDRREATKKQVSEDVSDSSVSKHLISADPTVGGDGENL